jgi:prevent-host-death family protein
MFSARASKFWRSCPNRRPSHGSHNSEARSEVPLSEIKDDLSRYLREAETQEIVITRHSKPAGVLIGFESEEDWFDYRLEHDARFLRRIEQAQQSARWTRSEAGGR